MQRYLWPSLLASVLLLFPAMDRCLADEYNVTLVCSADLYALGDSVFFVWCNDTDSTVVATYHPPYEIYEELSGELVYSGELPWEFHLPPNESAYLSWDQRDFWGEQVPPGAYRVHISFIFNDNPPPPWYSVDDWFGVLDTASVPGDDPTVSEISWGRLKLAHR